jgi:ribosome-associated protein
MHDDARNAAQRVEFALRGEFIELHQLLKLAGIAHSGGAGKHLVAEGAVRVDGEVETRKSRKLRAGQTVSVGGATIVVVADRSGQTP